MVSRRTSSSHKEDVFPRQVYSNSTCSLTCHWCLYACPKHSQECCWQSKLLPDIFSALPGLSPALLDAASCTQWFCQHCEMVRNISNSLCSYFCTSHQISQSPWRSAGIPSSGLELSENGKSMLTICILPDSTKGSWWLKYVLLMNTLNYWTNETEIN